jgi:PKD repeat protein
MAQNLSPTASFSGGGTGGGGFTLSPNLSGAGTVTTADGKINCTSNGSEGNSGICSATYANGTQVTMNGTPTSGGTVQWSSGTQPSCNGGNPCRVTMAQNLSPTASFSGGGTGGGGFTLSPNLSGAGTVTTADGKINCTSNGSGGNSGSCSAIYTSGAQVAMNATAVGGGTVQWSSGSQRSCNGNNPCLVTMTQNLNPTVSFGRSSGRAGGNVGGPAIQLSTPTVNAMTVSVNGVTQATAPNASIVRIAWNWGDGTTSQGWFPETHTYAQARSYTITATATDSNGKTSSAQTAAQVVPASGSGAGGRGGATPPTIQLSQPQVTGLTASINGGTAPTTSGATVRSITWSFGDGTPSVNSWFPVQHTFLRSGSFLVKAVATDSNGLIASATTNVTVNGSGTGSGSGGAGGRGVATPPTIQLSQPQFTGLTASINGGTASTTSGATVRSITWSFGDGTPSVNSWFPVQHTFPRSGSFLVKAVATDSNGLTASATTNVTINGSPTGSTGGGTQAKEVLTLVALNFELQKVQGVFTNLMWIDCFPSSVADTVAYVVQPVASPNVSSAVGLGAQFIDLYDAIVGALEKEGSAGAAGLLAAGFEQVSLQRPSAAGY